MCKEPPYKVEESGYAGFIMPIEVYFKNKVGSWGVVRRTHNSHEVRGPCTAGWMVTHVMETPCQAPAGGVTTVSPWQSTGELASWGAASHGPVSHARSGRVPGSAVTYWGGARVLGQSLWEERGRSGRYLDIQCRLLVGGACASSEPELLTALGERALSVVE